MKTTAHSVILNNTELNSTSIWIFRGLPISPSSADDIFLAISMYVFIGAPRIQKVYFSSLCGGL